MGLKSQVATLMVAFAMFKFFTSPPPEVTGELKTWLDSGQYFKFKDFNIFYKDSSGSGNGGTLVVFHGFPTSSFDWVKILPELRKHFSRVILFDFIGFGFSDKPTQHNYTISEQADIAESLLRPLGVTHVHLLAHDYGDTVALEMVARQDERRKDSLKITSLCMLNGGVFTETNHPRLLQRLLLKPWLGPVLSAFTNYALFKHGMSEVFGETTQPTDVDFWQFWTTFRYNHGDRVGYRILQYIPERTTNKERWEGAIRNTAVPVHMIYGPADPVNPRQFAEHYRNTVPSPSITVLPDEIAHYPQWEAPGAVLKSYLQFLQSLQT